ncbi:nickel/cobalt transporter [Prosthecomicrobium sp. N25]|uniref:nickel/cobalt transporter n=1 Tax=Prosthecomicrobium sp. N25 TaxID=3129254 RepID=UPI003076DE07
MPLSGPRPGRAAAVPLLAALMLLVAAPALAAGAGPFGVGAPEAASGAGSGVFGWIAQQQSGFYRALTGAVKLLKTDPAAAATLVGLSFLYGVFHAAGPGHGKAVIASYVVANDETLRRGVMLSFVSAFLQATVAILFVGAATYLLNLTSLAITEATRAFELASGVLVTALGLWLVWTKALRRGLVLLPQPRAALAGGPEAGHVHGPACGHETMRLVRPGLRSGGVAGGASAPAAMMVCADCGHGHVADPRTLAGPMPASRALAAVWAVGIRPCTGALIVLVFAFSQGLFWAGALSALAMAAGTGISVAALASLAVSMKGLATRLAGPDGPWAGRILRGAEILGACAILVLGVLLLGASLVGGTAGG